jgi:hypothetical protein
MSESDFYFILLDSDTGQTYQRTTMDCVSLPPLSTIAKFRDAVKNKDKEDGKAAVLTFFKSSQLLIYKNKAAFDQRGPLFGDGSLRISDPLAGLGGSEEDALIVAVPSSFSTCIEFFLIRRQ